MKLYYVGMLVIMFFVIIIDIILGLVYYRPILRSSYCWAYVRSKSKKCESCWYKCDDCLYKVEAQRKLVDEVEVQRKLVDEDLEGMP